MSANPCGCDPEAGHECTTHRIQHLEEMVQVLQDEQARLTGNLAYLRGTFRAWMAQTPPAAPDALMLQRLLARTT